MRKNAREREYSWIWPFPRLRFRLRHGFWCTHTWGDVVIADDWRKFHRCTRCDYFERV